MIGIYKITNLLDGQVYIGQSTDINKRLKQHKNEAFRENAECYNRPLYISIRQNGLDNFTFEIIEECNLEELNEREIYWINYYNSFNNGYNLTRGGKESTKIRPERIYELWDKGYSIKELTEEFHVCRTTIDKWLKLYSNYSVEEAYRRGGIKGYFKNSKIRKIIQYDMEGNPIKEWDSAKQIAKTLGLTEIGKCLKKEYYSSGGYRWGYEGESLISKDEIKRKAKSAKLNEREVKEIKNLLKEGIKQSEIAKKYFVTSWCISSINTGKSWKDDKAYPIYDYKNKKSNR